MIYKKTLVGIQYLKVPVHLHIGTWSSLFISNFMSVPHLGPTCVVSLPACPNQTRLFLQRSEYLNSFLFAYGLSDRLEFVFESNMHSG